MKVDLKSNAVRYAFYKAHNYESHYSKNVIEFREMRLDHIIPQRLFQYPSELKEEKLRLNLPAEFDLNSIENIVPCHYTENQDKRDYILPSASLDITVAREKAHKVIANLNRWNRKRQIEEDLLSKIKPHLIDSQIMSTEDAYNFLTNEDALFRCFESYVDDINHGSYSSSKGRVHLLGYLPTLHNNGACCNIGFKALELRSAFLSLNQADVASLDNDELKNRILKTAMHRDLKGKVFFQHRSNNFIIDSNDASELFELIHSFHEKAKIAQEKIHKYYGANEFATSQDNGGYILGRMKKGLWRALLRFGREFDMDNGNSEWHILDARIGSLIVSSNENRSELDPGFHTCFMTENIPDESIFSGNDEVFLTWRKIEPNEGEYNSRGYWNASTSFDWITKRLIPYVVWHSNAITEKKKFKLFRKSESFETFLQKFKIDDYLW